MLEPLKNRSIDLIVSNPPYVPSGELNHPLVAPDRIGLAFEPRSALDGGVDGYQFVNEIKLAGIPAITEGLGGDICTFNI
jgi:methylase of polypeptide subunit release factors